MGMLFNSDGTLRILKLLTETFSGHNFTNLKNDAMFKAALGQPVATTSTYSAAQMIHVDQDPGDAGNNIASQPSVTTNWGKWLNYLDAHSGNDTDNNGVTMSTVQWVRTTIENALNDNNCIGVEFFAVPGPTLAAMVPFQKVYDRTNNALYTIAIAVQTITVDKVP